MEPADRQQPAHNDVAEHPFKSDTNFLCSVNKNEPLDLKYPSVDLTQESLTAATGEPRPFITFPKPLPPVLLIKDAELAAIVKGLVAHHQPKGKDTVLPLTASLDTAAVQYYNGYGADAEGCTAVVDNASNTSSSRRCRFNLARALGLEGYRCRRLGYSAGRTGTAARMFLAFTPETPARGGGAAQGHQCAACGAAPGAERQRQQAEAVAAPAAPAAVVAAAAAAAAAAAGDVGKQQAMSALRADSQEPQARPLFGYC